MNEALQESFARARELPPGQREPFLAELEGSDPELARRLRELLAAAEGGDSPLDRDPWAEETRADIATPTGAPAEVLPESIGPYRVLSELGRGGMGRVYLVLHEGDGFSRRLAVKTLAPEGSGPEIERRFREERRILAALEHPGIARFHDAGRDRDGRWYLALEYVEGAGLVEHARAHLLPTEERLRLFLAVLQAVAYAHERGVVHRDLKPANILVGPDGRPRLLDFGIAKLLDSAATSVDTETRTEHRVLTPAYASPEQFRGESVTPASDVFSLGVLLYELVTGMRPFGGEGLSPAKLERAVLEAEPLPPSVASRSTATRTGERADAGAAVPLPSRTLDAICLKALRKRPEERYPTARELTLDLERHLAGEPVAARREARRYRLSRLLARSRAALVVSFALLAVALAFALVFDGARRAGDSPRSEPPPQPFRFGGISGKDVPALERLFVEAPGDVDAGVRLALALDLAGRGDDAELIVARLRQIPGHGEDPLIDYVEASLAATAKKSQRALVLFDVALARAVASGRGELVAQIRAARGRLRFTLGQRGEALADMESARRSFERAQDPASLARVLNDLAIDPLSNGRLAEGEVLLEQALAASRASTGGAGGGAGVISMNLALISIQRGFPDRAEPRLRESIETFRQSKSRRLGFATMALSRALFEQGRNAEARERLAEAFVLLGASADEGTLSYALRLRGEDELRAGHPESATRTAKELEELAKSRGDRLPLALSNRLRGEISVAGGDLVTAEYRFAEARRQFLENADREEADELDVVWAESALAAGEIRRAETIARRVRPEGSPPVDRTVEFLAEAVLARVDARLNRPDAARRRLDSLEILAAGSTSVRRREGLARVRAAVAGAQASGAE